MNVGYPKIQLMDIHNGNKDFRFLCVFNICTSNLEYQAFDLLRSKIQTNEYPLKVEL